MSVGGQFVVGVIPSQPYVAIINRDGTNLKRLMPGMLPAWSPDGSKIIYTDYKFRDDLRDRSIQHYRLFDADADGKNVHPIAPDRSANASFSPDGTKIAYIGNIGDGSAEIFLANADGSESHRIKTEVAVYSSPRGWARAVRRCSKSVALTCRETAARQAALGSSRLRDSSLDGSSRTLLSPGHNNMAGINCTIDADVESILNSAGSHPADARIDRTNPARADAAAGSVPRAPDAARSGSSAEHPTKPANCPARHDGAEDRKQGLLPRFQRAPHASSRWLLGSPRRKRDARCEWTGSLQIEQLRRSETRRKSVDRRATMTDFWISAGPSRDACSSPHQRPFSKTLVHEEPSITPAAPPSP